MLFMWEKQVSAKKDVYMGGLVSIITPCYNSGKFVHRLMDSILTQTYLSLEMFVIDDGSTDNTAAILKSYISKFESRGSHLTYVYQENEGQSVAVNNGLKLFKGDYLVWPDSDDFYAADDAIEQMVSILEKSDESVGMVRTHARLLGENTFQIVGHHCVNSSSKGKTDLFKDCLFGRNGYWFGPGDYMVKTDVLLKVLPDRTIYTSKAAGQNWQLMLPVLYNHQCITIERALYAILVRRDSHSRGWYQSYDEQCAKFASYESTLLHTIENLIFMPRKEKDELLGAVKTKYLKIHFSLSQTFHKKSDLREIYLQLEDIGSCSVLCRFVLVLSYFPGGLYLWTIAVRAKKLVLRIRRSLLENSERLRCLALWHRNL